MSALRTISFLIFFLLGPGSIYPVLSQVDLSGDYDLTSLQKMLLEAREKKSERDLADVYWLLGEFHEKKKFNSEFALDFYIRAKQYYDKLGIESQSNLIKQYIANRYFESGFLNESLELYREALDFYRRTKDKKQEAHVLYEMSRVFLEKGDVEQNLHFLNQSIAINEDLKDSTLLVYFYLDKVKSYMDLNEMDSALITSTLAFDVSSDLDNAILMSKSIYYIGEINHRQGDYERAIKYLEKSLEISPAIPYDEARRQTYNTLAEAYQMMFNYEKSYAYARKYININDSILDHDRILSINNLSIKHQTAEKSKEIQFLELEKQSVLQKNLMQRNALYFVAAGFGLLLLALYYIIRFYSQKIRTETIINDQQHKIDQQKIKELEDLMQINNMQSMIVGQERERERIAKDLHDSLGGLLSTVKLQFDQVKTNIISKDASTQYDKAANLLDTAVEEVRTISRNLQPVALSKLGIIPALNDLFNRFEGEAYPEIYFQHYNIPKRLDGMVALNIYRIIQEFLTNTIKYAEATEVLVQLNFSDQEIYIQYEDDGIGFDPESLEQRGMGLDNINSRIKYLKGQISWNSKPGEGVSVMVKIPYEES